MAADIPIPLQAPSRGQLGRDGELLIASMHICHSMKKGNTRPGMCRLDEEVGDNIYHICGSVDLKTCHKCHVFVLCASSGKNAVVAPGVAARGMDRQPAKTSTGLLTNQSAGGCSC